MMAIEFPFHLHRRGADTPADDQRVVRDMIEQVLLTTAGERVNRPDFGCGLLQLTFGTMSDVLETTLQTTIAGALQQWIGDLVQVQGIQVQSGLQAGAAVASPESSLLVTISYVDVWTQQHHRIQVQVPQ
jgi:phage baseplate assembly protein W